MSSADFGRVIHIAKQRERTKEDIEKAKQKLEEERRTLEHGITSKFTNHVDKVEEQLKAETIGLVTLDKLKEKQKDITGKA
ncbi:XAP5 protein [Aphelenchoides avenae]|nr:XAP5 protein [Aphelenchus avenae]